ncbi:unnamed protein product [Clavelina lepadiformis]|uniref:protein-tyrosine-phosphatase n=1 Tax=Clavelina lepadiformis TaxID=159417 RepID=A0ABP0F3W0_CLALP
MDDCYVLKRIVILVTIFLWIVPLSQAECPNNTVRVGETFYVMSHDQLDFVGSEKQCAAMGGRLADFQDLRTAADIKQKMNELYENGLSEVEVYQYTVNYKYVLMGTYNGYGALDSSFPTFKLYKKPRAEYNAKFIFCKASYNWYYRLYQKWSVQTTSCTNGWTHDFTLYGGEKDRGTKPVYRYHNSAYSVRLSLSDEPSNTTWPGTVNYDTRLSPLYIPDLQIQTGIRSGFNQSDWISDNQVVNSFPFDLPPANKDKCQQLTLRYNDVDWVASAVECGSTTAYYYMCQIKFSIQAEAIMCNSTSVLVSWNLTLYKDLFFGDADVTLNIHVGPDLHLINGTLGTFIVPNLKPRTTYRIFAEFWHSCSTKFLRSDDVNVTTSYGKPEAVTTAYVANNTASDDCVIEWSRDNSDGNITSYEIVANNLFNSSIKLNVTSGLFEMGSTRYTIPSELLAIYGYNRNISFKIIAYSCEGSSMPMSVNGYCVVVPPVTTPEASSSSVEVYIVAPSLVTLILLLAITGVFAYRRNTGRFHTSTKRDVSIDPGTVIQPRMQNNVTPAAMKDEETVVEREGIEPVYNKRHEANTNLAYSEEVSVYENVSSTNLSGGVHIDKLEHFYNTRSSNDFQSIKDEFQSIKKRSANKPHEAANLNKNKKKNRYKNIYPFDDSRVVLQSDDDYINASHIKGFCGKKTYIATQGAKDCTIPDFWQMVWEQNSSVIVMLCKLREESKIKCSAYWPVQGSTVTHGNFTIKTTFEDDLGWVITRRFCLINESSQKNREIFHLQLVSWPDHGVPTATSPLMYLRRMVKEATDDEPNQPVIVHCSAGAGRTGTFIAMDILFDELDQTSVVDVPGAITRMRERRVDMVQTEDQYVLVYKLLVEHAVYKDTDISAPDYLKLSRQSHWDSRFENEFKLFTRLSSTEQFSSNSPEGTQSSTGDINRFKTSFSGLSTTRLERISSFLGNIFAVSGPVLEEEKQFWDFVAELNTSVLVCLETLEADLVTRSTERISSQIPNSDRILSVENVQRSEGLVERKVTLSTSHTKIQLNHLQVESWNGEEANPDSSYLSNAINMLQTLVKEKERVVVYCRDGCTRTGTFIALLNLVERLKSENRIDVFRTIKDLRDMRPNMVNNLDLYRFCYKFMENYLKDFQTYGNFQ